MPIFIRDTPEGLSIVSELAIAIQLANVVAFVYVWAQSKYDLSYTLSIAVIIFTGILTSFLLGLLWNADTSLGNTSVRLV